MFLWVLTSLYPLQVCIISLTTFKEFRKFWTCYFVDTLVKCTNNFWKVRGLIGGFNKYCRQITSGVKKTADYSMSAIQFCTTPKGDLLHYFYILRKPDPLATEMNNMACLELGTMLHLEMKNGKETMKTSELKIYIRGTTACIKRLSIATKGCVQPTSNNTYFADSCLSSVKTSEEAMAVGVDYCGLAKMIRKGFCLATLEKLTGDWPGGSYIVMKIT